MTSARRPLDGTFTLTDWRRAAGRSLTRAERRLLNVPGGAARLIQLLAAPKYPARITPNRWDTYRWTWAFQHGEVPGIRPLSYAVQMEPGYTRCLSGLQTEWGPFFAFSGELWRHGDGLPCGEGPALVRFLTPLEVLITSAAVDQRRAAIVAQSRWLDRIAELAGDDRTAAMEALLAEGPDLVRGFKGHDGLRPTGRVEFDRLAELRPVNLDWDGDQWVQVGPDSLDHSDPRDKAIWDLVMLVLSRTPTPAMV